MLYKWEAKCFRIWRDREQAVRDNGHSSKAIKPTVGKVLFANSGKIAELEIFDPTYGLPFYVIELPSGENLVQFVRKCCGEGYDFVDVLSSERVVRGSYCN
jgi:hypothetical protein